MQFMIETTFITLVNSVL